MPIHKYECSECNISEELLQKIAKTDEEEKQRLIEAKTELCPFETNKFIVEEGKRKLVFKHEECKLRRVVSSSNHYIKRYANKW